MMPLAPSYSFTMMMDAKGVHVRLFHTETLASKDFFLAGAKSLDSIAAHMDSLTEDQCSSFIAVKVAKKKEKKVDSGQALL